MANLTAPQLRILRVIVDSVDAGGVCRLSYQEIGARAGLRARSTIHKHVGVLMADGYVTRPHGHARSLEPTALAYAKSSAHGSR